ncbi:MAG: carboxymuconolactone decarboxylase family protein [Deltaproteobacteria bacterium]|nr:MAG: carboxymuconolactone decarboxylase family protein [Deltaproteobacteria bacterium]
MAKKVSQPPRTYKLFIERFPHLGEAWENMRAQEAAGPLDEHTARLIKLAVAIGGLREGAVHSCVRKALAAGATREEIDHVIALAASTIGLPTVVAAYSWVLDELPGGKPKKKKR